MGYIHFQGYFFCKPAVVEGREIPGNKLKHVQLIEAVNAPKFNIAKIEAVLKREPSLVYELLRYLNSPFLGLRSETRSISHAMVSMAEDKSPELIRTALTRGYFCEEISGSAGLSTQKSDLFLMGLLSVTDAILDMPMQNILAHLPLSSDVRTALNGGANRFRDVYDTLLSYERADWSKLSSLTAKSGSPEDRIPECYLSAANRAVCVPL